MRSPIRFPYAVHIEISPFFPSFPPHPKSISIYFCTELEMKAVGETSVDPDGKSMERVLLTWDPLDQALGETPVAKGLLGSASR